MPDIPSIFVLCVAILLIVLIEFIAIASLVCDHLLQRRFERPSVHDEDGQRTRPEEERPAATAALAGHGRDDVSSATVSDHYSGGSEAVSSVYSVPTPPPPAKSPAIETRLVEYPDSSDEILRPNNARWGYGPGLADMLAEDAAKTEGRGNQI
tara:strand:+ start:3479 stop:3937 length:459 start_codon:yes stop_codon:yes gene_type:complete